MPSLSRKFGWLQAPIGGFGFLAWMAAFQGSTWLRERDLSTVADAVAGYILGFGAAFAWWVAHQLYKGHYAKFVEDHRVWKWFSIFTLGVIGLFGAVGFAISLFANVNWQFNIGFALGGFVMGACFGPLIEAADGL